MTRASWAERAINKLPMALGSDSVDAKAAIKLVEAEHRRAVRVVKRQLDLYQRQHEVEEDEYMRDLLAGSILACVDLLESLQRGRE